MLLLLKGMSHHCAVPIAAATQRYTFYDGPTTHMKKFITPNQWESERRKLLLDLDYNTVEYIILL